MLHRYYEDIFYVVDRVVISGRVVEWLIILLSFDYVERVSMGF